GSKFPLGPGEWFVSATFKEDTSFLGLLGGKTGSIPQGAFTLTEEGDPVVKGDVYKLKINFAGLGVNPKKRAVTVTLTVKHRPDLSGLQPGPATVIGMRWRERFHGGSAALSASTLNTMIHEPGHAMGLASTTFPDGSACATTYFKAGHHCNNISNQCVMYEANSTSITLCD